MAGLQSARLNTLALVSVFLGAGHAWAQAEDDPIAKIVGQWDQVDSMTSIEIRPDHSVQHSGLGAGDIKHDNADFYSISYRHQHLECRYQIKKYSDTELKVVRALKTDSLDCELGMLRRAPGSSFTTEERGKGDDEAGAGARKADAERDLRPTAVFKDCEGCPDMVVVPAGDFTMGSPETEPGRRSSEGPLHRVSFAKPFAAGRYPITRDEFAAFVTATAYRYEESCHAEQGNAWVDLPGYSFLSPPGFTQEGRHPVVCVSWKDANEYVKWLSAETKKSYRLLTEAEREYIARAGTSTPYWWGESLSPEDANFDKRERSKAPGPQGGIQALAGNSQLGALGETPGRTVPVHWFKPNVWGFFQVHGNVAEWVQDCWNTTYTGASADGAPAETGDCSKRVLRGGGWNHWPEDIRAAYREAAPSTHRYYEVGFRVARNLGD